ncbi:MAG: TrmH family RNA methyltransferase [Actinomycetota bacterium]
MITSPNNPKVLAAARLKKRTHREREERFLVEGVQGVAEALASGRLEQLFHTPAEHDLAARARRDNAAVDEVSDEVMAKLTSTVTPQGLVGVVPQFDVGLDSLDDHGCVAVLHAVRDPGNAGTILRSADAAGCSGVVFSSSSVEPYNPKAVRASAGSLFHLPLVRGVQTPDALDSLRSAGRAVLAMGADGDVDLYEVDLQRPVAFVFGNEAWGLPSDVLAQADAHVRIPLAGSAESLNLAAAATVCLFEWARRSREGRRVALEAVIASAAHDIRSPLTAMKGFAYALQRRWSEMSDEQRLLMFQGIAHDTDRMDQILTLLVDAARIVGNRLELSPEIIDVGKLVEDVDASMRRDPEFPGLQWQGGEVTAFVDADRLRTVLGAFVEGEIWFGWEGPISVDARVHEQRLLLTVTRTGTELTGSDAETLFLPRRPGTGSGSKIGLFVSRGIAEVQGGSARASVEDGRLVFRLDIPSRSPD